METFEVIQPGPLTSVQDAGRYGYQQYGVPPSGALDNYSYRVGNMLAGNCEDAPSLEITLFGCRLRVLRDTVVAITGADLGATLNGKPMSLWESVKVVRDDKIVFPRLITGCRAYLAVAGGITVPQVMASAATYIRAGMGGFEGRVLHKGDILHTGEEVGSTPGKRIPVDCIPHYGNQVEVRVVLGPQDDYFTDAGIQTFLSSVYTVSVQADRMGYRLEGARIQHKAKADIVSDGIPPGAVQVPGDGLPIILLADRQTTGGYTKIAAVISVDISLIAQTKPGDTIRFRQVTMDEAVNSLWDGQQKLRKIREILVKQVYT